MANTVDTVPINPSVINKTFSDLLMAVVTEDNNGVIILRPAVANDLAVQIILQETLATGTQPRCEA